MTRDELAWALFDAKSRAPDPRVFGSVEAVRADAARLEKLLAEKESAA